MSNKVPNDQKLTVDEIDEIDAFEPSTERERFSFDLGYEQGHQERDAEDRPRTVDETLERIKETLRELIDELGEHIEARKTGGR